MIDLLAAAGALLPGMRLEPVHVLRGGTSAQVHRVIAHGPGGSTPLVVKAFGSAREGWAREAAALSVLGDRGLAPHLVAVSGEQPVVVMTDVGSGLSLADRLLGNDPVAAARTTARWAGSVARLHAATLDARERFGEALDRFAGDLPIAIHTMPVVLAEAAAAIEKHCDALGAAVPPGAVDALRGLAELLPDGEHAALTPTDACPDNNIEVGDRLVLVDFEGAEFRHVAWDAAYLTVPWPSCWCSWRLPDEVAAAALEAYRVVLAGAMPYVRTDQFARDVNAAAAGWALISASWLLNRALADDPPMADPSKVSPTRRAMILHRLGAAAVSPELPVLAELAARLRAALVQRWGEMPLAYAPAFAR